MEFPISSNIQKSKKKSMKNKKEKSMTKICKK